MSVQNFEGIYRDLGPAIRRYLARLAGPDAADDLSQEVFARIAKALPAFEGRSSVSTWVYRIATNAGIDYRRSAAFKKRSTDNGCINTMAAPVDPIAPDAEMLDCVREFADTLPESYRTAFILHELECMPNAEVARVLGLTLPTAKIRIHRGKELLKKKMQNGCCLYYDEAGRLACSRKG